MKYAVPIKLPWPQHRKLGQGVTTLPARGTMNPTILIADESSTVQSWLFELLRIRKEWTVSTVALHLEVIAEALPQSGTPVVLLGGDNVAPLLKLATGLKSACPEALILLFAPFESPEAVERVTAQGLQAVVSRNTIVAAAVLAGVQALLRGETFQCVSG